MFVGESRPTSAPYCTAAKTEANCNKHTLKEGESTLVYLILLKLKVRAEKAFCFLQEAALVRPYPQVSTGYFPHASAAKQTTRVSAV